MANEMRYMARIAVELKEEEGREYFQNWYEKIRSDINGKLWCEEERFYYDYDIQNNCFNKVQSVSSFLPLFA